MQGMQWRYLLTDALNELQERLAPLTCKHMHVQPVWKAESQ